MSDQPGIPAITVFPPFNPAARPAEPAPPAVREEAPAPVSETPAAGAAEVWDSAAPAAPMPWDFEAPAGPPSEPTPPAEAAPPAHEDAPVSDEEDLPWLEVPTPRPASSEAAQSEIRAEDRPNFADWMRTEEQPPLAPEAQVEGDVEDAGVMPVEQLEGDAAEDAWTEGTTGEEPWKPAEAAGGWRPAEPAEPEAWSAPEPELGVPEPELYDLPPVAPSAAASPSADAEPAWELPSADAAASVPAAGGVEAPRGADPFAGVAYRLEQAAAALRENPEAFAAGGAGADPLDLLLTGFVLGWQAARQGS